MSSSVLAPLALTVSTGALLALPLTPAIRELLSKRDAGPLVTRKDDGKIENFASSFRSRCEVFEPWLSRCTESKSNQFLDLPDARVLIIGGDGPWSGPMQTDRLVLCARASRLPDGFTAENDFYARAGVRSGRNSLFRALLSETDAELGEGTQVLRWIHAESSLNVERACILLGRASGGLSMTLSPGVMFERIGAPIIYSSAKARSLELKTESAAFSKLAQAGIGRTRVHGRVHLVADEQHFGDLVSTTRFEVDDGARVFGSVKANGDAHLRSCAEVHGSVVSTKRIFAAPGCFIKGPLIAEQEIIINSGVQIGLPSSPTTVSAPRIRIAPGSVLHGTVWARAEGRVGD